MEPILELVDVRKSYGDFTAVSGVSMAVPPGSIFGLLGPNGAGKTTTIRMIMDIIAPDSGEVRFFGHPRTAKDLGRIGYLPEERGLYRKMTVVDQLLFLAEIRGLKSRDALPEIERWLERFELASWGKKKVEELSKGMQQKVQLIGTVLHKPDILILDEPFSGLDPLNQEMFREFLVESRRQGKSVLFSTHGMELAERMCDHICLISHGRAVLTGELSAIKRRLSGNSYRLVADGDLARLAQVPGVEQVLAQERSAKLLLAPDADGAAVLRQIVQFADVREFRSEEPELEEIFIKAVRDAA
ncbi:MAG: type transport system ATP-binding protein [Acidobacteriota bacterium]|jgi:ABC-2 type transport system ATP-binding protein|nr:type transport system ATP-binding protein [Acidobacteriota bacterium]